MLSPLAIQVLMSLLFSLHLVMQEVLSQALSNECSSWIALKSTTVMLSTLANIYISFTLKLTLAWSLCVSMIPISKKSSYSFLFPFLPPFPMFSNLFLSPHVSLHTFHAWSGPLFLSLDSLYHIRYHPYEKIDLVKTDLLNFIHWIKSLYIQAKRLSSAL